MCLEVIKLGKYSIGTVSSNINKINWRKILEIRFKDSLTLGCDDRDRNLVCDDRDRNTVSRKNLCDGVYEPWKIPTADGKYVEPLYKRTDTNNLTSTLFEESDIAKTLDMLDMFRKIAVESFAQSVYKALDGVLTYGYENYSGESLELFEKGIDKGIMAFEKLCEESNIKLDVEAL